MIDDDWQDLFTYENERDAGVNAFRGALIGSSMGVAIYGLLFVVYWLVTR